MLSENSFQETAGFYLHTNVLIK